MRLEDTDICYLIEVSNDKEGPNEFRITNEELTGPSFMVKSNPDRDDSVQTQSDSFPLLLNMFLAIKEEDPKIQIKFEPALEKIGEFMSMTRPFKKRLEPYIQQIIDIFANMRFLELSPDQMREPAFPWRYCLGRLRREFAGSAGGHLLRPQAQRDSRRLVKRTHTNGYG